MQISTNKQIGKNSYTFTGEGKNMFEAITDLGKASFGNVPQCGLCGSDALYLEAHLAQGKFKYHSIKCGKCKGSLTFGTPTEDSDISYLRRNEDKSFAWQAFVPSTKKD